MGFQNFSRMKEVTYHHPLGTNNSSPALHTPSRQPASLRASAWNVRRYSAILKGLVTSLLSSETKTPGGCGTLGGNMSQYFEPSRTAFHAWVPLGSLWKVEPLRSGPMTTATLAHNSTLIFFDRLIRSGTTRMINLLSQRCAGLSLPSRLKRSSPKHSGGQ